MGPVPTGITLSLTRETGQHQFGFDNDISITLSLKTDVYPAHYSIVSDFREFI